MQNDMRDQLWFSRSEIVTIAELAGLAGLTEAEVRELGDNGVLAPVNLHDPAWTFSGDCAVTAHQARRLRQDLELDTHALALTLELLSQIRSLESELSQLRAQQSALGRS